MKQIDIDFDGNQSTGNARICRFFKGSFWSEQSAHMNEGPTLNLTKLIYKYITDI